MAAAGAVFPAVSATAMGAADRMHHDALITCKAMLKSQHELFVVDWHICQLVDLQIYEHSQNVNETCRARVNLK